MENSTENNTSAKVVAVKKSASKSTSPAKRVRNRTSQKKEMPIPEIKDGKPVDVRNPEFYLNREINWIDFDRKVLEQAQDPSVPLL